MTSGSTSSWDPHPDLAWLVALARRLAQPGEDADDLAQETWLVATQNPDRSKGSSRSWLAGVLRNLRRMRARTNMRRHQREQCAAPTESASPEAALEQLETLEALRHALGALDPVDRRLVLGRYATGHSAVQLGEQFDLPASTVRTRLDRARQRLRRDVESACGVACLVPWRPAAISASVGQSAAVGGALAMSATTKLTIGAVALAIVALGAQRLVAEPRDSTPRLAAVATAGDPPPALERRAVRPEELRIKRERIHKRREQRLAAIRIAPPGEPSDEIVSERCEAGCIGTLELQHALAQVVSGCRDGLAAEARGRTKFRAHVIAEPDVGAVIDAVEVLEDTVANAEFTECIVQSAPLAALADPENPISDNFVFRYTVGPRPHPAGEFLAAYPELAEEHPELAALMTVEPGAPVSDDDATAFAHWIEQDSEAQAAFAKWAATEGLDLANVRVE